MIEIFQRENWTFSHFVFIEHSNCLQTTFYKKPTNRQNYLHEKSAHPLLRMKRFCSTFNPFMYSVVKWPFYSIMHERVNEYKKHSNDLVKRFVEKEYKENIIRNQIEKVDNLERTTLLNKTNVVWKNVIPFS